MTPRLLPSPLRAHILHFETVIQQAVMHFARSLPGGARVLDAGAGEGQYKSHFERHRYTAVDLGIGDTAWNYAGLDCIARLEFLPFREATFDACVNIVTLEHVPDPAQVLAELARTLAPGGRLLLVVPHEWEEHQTPHDYWRFTRYGLARLLARAGFERIDMEPIGGFFRLLARRMAAAPQFFPPPLSWLALLALAPAVLLLPFFDPIDKKKNFTLGFLCHAYKRS